MNSEPRLEQSASSTTISADRDSLERRPSTVSTAYTSTASSSSPELTTDTTITPESDDDAEIAVVPKLEDLEDTILDGIEEKLVRDLSIPWKRRRPRKHPVSGQKKSAHARSKTGCGTCRRRKKKYDETKPFCLNCKKNNVVCDGYSPREPWQSGRQGSLTLRTQVPADLPLLVEGIEGKIDQMFFQHFTCQLGKVLSLSDCHNPLLEIIVPLSMSHTGLMHSLLYLSGSCLIVNQESPTYDWELRSEHHSSTAIQLLKEDLVSMNNEKDEGVSAVSNPSIAQTLILCLQTVCAGDLTGS